MASDFLELKKKLPELGIGLGLRKELAMETLAHRDSIDWLEVIPENYMDIGGATRDRLDTVRSLFPMVSHGINLSIGSTDELNVEYLKSLKRLLDDLNCPWFSDHICFTSFDGVYMQDLLPMPLNREAVNHVAERARRVQDFVGRPFLLENISFYMQMPGTDMQETDFISEVLEKADCGLLLDVNNVYVNSLNHSFDPLEYVDKLPLERVVQIHVAGHKRVGDYVIDTHGAAVVEPVFEILARVLERASVKAVMLERDQNFPDFSELLAELVHIRKVCESSSLFANLHKTESDVNTESLLAVLAADKSARGREVRVLSA